MFPSMCYDELDPIYRKELLKFVQEIEEIEKENQDNSGEKVFNLWKEFSSNYLMPKILWEYIFSMIKGFNDVDIDRSAFQYDFHFGNLSNSNQEILNVQTLRRKKLCENSIYEYGVLVDFSVEENCYPHDKLEEKWRGYEMYGTKSLIPKAVCQRFEKMKNLYYKILSIENDTEEWIKTLNESDDYEFVVDNIEFRLSENLGNKELWKLYIQYLQNNGHFKKLLEIFSKYCRYFLEDSEMLEEYQKAAEKYGPSVVPWKNTKSFEIYDKNFFEVFDIPVTDAFAPVIDAALTYHFDPKTTSSQKFPFRHNLMDYIIKHATAPVLFDFYKTCKWFYSFFPVGLIYKLNASTWIGNKIGKQSIEISHLNHLKLDMKIYVSSVFRFDFPDVSALTNFMPNIYRCSAKIVIIRNQNLTFNELKFLIGHGEVVELHFSVKDENGNPFKFEEILTLIPKIQILDIRGTVCSPNISQFLCDFPFQNKIQSFSFGDVTIMPDSNAFAQFILKNASLKDNNRFSFYYYLIQNDDQNFDSDEEFDDEEEMDFNVFKSIVNNIISDKWKGLKRPHFNF